MILYVNAMEHNFIINITSLRQILQAVEPTYFGSLKERTFGFAYVPITQFLSHFRTTYGTLRTTYGTLDVNQLKTNRYKLSDKDWNPPTNLWKTCGAKTNLGGGKRRNKGEKKEKERQVT
jgi:hypothetical protein